MKTIDLNKEQIPSVPYGYRIYMAFDDNGDQGSIITRDISKNQLVHLYSELYSAYLKLWNDNKRLRGELDELMTPIPDVQNHESAMEGAMEEYINHLIDKRITEKLSLGETSEPYSGCYARLTYGDDELGNVCLKSYYDD